MRGAVQHISGATARVVPWQLSVGQLLEEHRVAWVQTGVFAECDPVFILNA